ncbi:MAG: MEDS domain-containing protein [Opitutaceae bacterium]
MLQIYERDELLGDSLEGFVRGSLVAGESVIVIATEAHRDDLTSRLRRSGVDVAAALASEQLIPRDAEEMLAEFMLKGWPDDAMFEAAIGRILNRAQAGKRRVRAFGEMVAVLWSKGSSGATVRLEHLWNQFIHKADFSLFCAYPKSGFTRDALQSLQEICTAHTRVIES